MNTTSTPTLFRKAAALAVTFAAITTAAPAQSIPAQPTKENTTERIGIYDSRAVAVAYAGSQFQKVKMQDLINHQQKAKEAGDKKEITRLEAEGRAWQAQLHRQGFGTAAVDDILAHIANELPRIQQDTGVTNLISKWDKPELQKHPGTAQIDVTMKLVDAFHPSELQRKRAIEIQTKLPVKFKE
jgi:hypothetical protein